MPLGGGGLLEEPITGADHYDAGSWHADQGDQAEHHQDAACIDLYHGDFPALLSIPTNINFMRSVVMMSLLLEAVRSSRPMRPL